MNPAFAGNKFTAAGVGLATRDENETDDEHNEEAGRFHGRSLNEIVAAASVVHVGREVMPDVPKYLKGQLLLDGGELTGTFFHRTVVLICQHDAEGAFGLVLNRQSGKTVGDSLVADLPDVLKESSLFLGGPVQPTALSFLHTDSFIPDANVFPNLNLEHSLDALLELGESFSPTRKLKLFAGYAGWSPGQLEAEMNRKAWLTHPASLELIFDTSPEKIWPVVLRRKGGWQNRILSQSPEDLSWN